MKYFKSYKNLKRKNTEENLQPQNKKNTKQKTMARQDNNNNKKCT